MQYNNILWIINIFYYQVVDVPSTDSCCALTTEKIPYSTFSVQSGILLYNLFPVKLYGHYFAGWKSMQSQTTGRGLTGDRSGIIVVENMKM